MGERVRVVGGLVAVAACAAAGLAFAFDSEAWSAKNAAMTTEAVRMKEAFATYSAQANDPAEHVTIPFEMFDTGEIKAQVVAAYGKFFNDAGFVWAKDVTVEQYGDKGSVDMRLKADSCLVDYQRKCCWIAGHVTAYHRKTTLEGDDAFFCSSNNFLKVMTNAKIVSEDVVMKGLKL